MMPAAKHGDPQVGVDIHLCTTPAGPVPLPTPHTSVVFDPFDYIPMLGATVTICGMKRATAGTSATAVHIPPGLPFAPMLPLKDDELFMGSATVVADGDPMSFIGVPVLSCQVAGMPSIPRPRKKGPKKMNLGPLTFNLAIPTTVLVGGPPTISMMGMAMKGAFAGLGKLAKSGVFKRMRQKLFKNVNPGFLKCTILRAEPVNILSGAVAVEHLDFTLPGRIPITWPRVYASDNQHAGHCGVGWETPADARLEITHEGVLMHYPGLGPLSFDGLPAAEGDAAAVLELQDGAVLTDTDGEYRVRTKEDRVYHFPKRRLMRSTDGVHRVALARISDFCGNWLRLERSGGVLTSIEESAGRRLEFSSDQGRIREIALVVPGVADRHVFVRYDYNPDGDLEAVRDALDHPYTFEYDAHHMVRHTDRNGLSFYYAYEITQGEWRVEHAWGDGGLYDYRFAYSDVLNERRITDSLGNVSLVKLNELGLPINEIDALGGVTIYEYDEVGRTIGITDQDGHRTAFLYDPRGNLRELTRPDGTVTRHDFDTLNKLVRVVDALGNEWHQRWDARGLLLEQRTPLTVAARFQYDDYGILSARIDSAGARTEISFDAYGNLVRLQDSLGHITRFGHDILGNVTGKLDALGRKTLYCYDTKSRLTAAQLPEGQQIACEYDREDHLTSYTDTAGMQTRFEYFGQGKPARRIQPDGQTVEYLYDSEERLIGTRNQRGELYQLKRDALGRLTEEIDYWGQRRTYQYSLAGQLRASTDAAARTLTYLTDPLGRILKKTLPHPNDPQAQVEESFEYDLNGNLIAASRPHLRIERRLDAAGRLLEEKQGKHFAIRNTFDAAGNRTLRETILLHDAGTTTHRVHYSYDLLGQPIEIRVDDEPPVQLQRNALGQIVRESFGKELTREHAYDLAARLTQQRLHRAESNLSLTRYSYDSSGNLTERADSATGIDRFGYDPLGRVLHHVDPTGKLQTFLRDPAGELLQVRSFTEQRDTSLWSASHEGTQYEFDRNGNLSVRDDRRGTLTLEWDANQRLVKSRTHGIDTHYEYDPIGRRTHKITGGVTTLFCWDGDVLVGEARLAGDTPALAREYVYYPGGFEPLARIDVEPGQPTATVLYFHNEPNGSPTLLTDGNGAAHWRARYSPSGAAIELAASTDNALRLQGQYYDVETGLHYNLHRYYDPHIAQFVSPDPLGLAAGENLYRYANNTFNWIDPLGLACRNTWNEFQKHHKGQFANSANASAAYHDLIARQSPWPIGFTPTHGTLPAGTRIRMAMAPGQPATRPGGFATADSIPDVAYVRNELAVKEAWKPQVDNVVTYEVTRPVPVKMGPVGPQVDKGTGDYLRGGGTQVELDVPPADRMNYLKVVDTRACQKFCVRGIS